MAITLEKLCVGCEEKYSMKLMGGAKGTDRTVRWVHIIEDRDVPRFLHGDELIFTTGIGRINGENNLYQFVRSLKEKDATGIVLNIGPYISHIPEKVIEYCNENNFPLYSIPWNIRIIDITYDFCSSIIENRKNEVSLADAFKRIIKNESFIAEYRDVFHDAGFDDNNPFIVCAVELFQSDKLATERVTNNNSEKLWRIFQMDKAATAMFVEDNVLIIIKQKCEIANLYSSFEKLEQHSKSGDIHFVAGLSEVQNGLSNLSSIYRQAMAALSTALADSLKTVEYKSIGIDKIICSADSMTLRNFVETVIGGIEDYDRAHNTHFMDFLKCYIENNASVFAVSEIMGVHRNTVNYQIGRIKSTFYLQLDEAEKADFLLAFRIIKLNEKRQLL